LKKSLSGLNILFRFVSGGLILYGIFRLFQKMIKPKNQLQTNYNWSSVLPKKEGLTFEDIFDFISVQEGPPNFTAVKDGKKKDGTQLYSIGYGHQIQPNETQYLSSPINDAQAYELFQNDIFEIVDSINKAIKVPVNKNQKLALLSLRYNIGESAFNNSTLLKLLNSRDYLGAAGRFAEWRISEGKINQGLVNRRERERSLFLKPV
jgi:lysozyme